MYETRALSTHCPLEHDLRVADGLRVRDVGSRDWRLGEAPAEPCHRIGPRGGAVRALSVRVHRHHTELIGGTWGERGNLRQREPHKLRQAWR